MRTPLAVSIAWVAAACGGTHVAPNQGSTRAPRVASSAISPGDRPAFDATTPPMPIATAAPLTPDAMTGDAVVEPTPTCAPFDWSPHALTPLLRSGSKPNLAHPDAARVESSAFDGQCSDEPPGMGPEPGPRSVVAAGVELCLVTTTPAGRSGRGG